MSRWSSTDGRKLFFEAMAKKGMKDKKRHKYDEETIGPTCDYNILVRNGIKQKTEDSSMPHPVDTFQKLLSANSRFGSR